MKTLLLTSLLLLLICQKEEELISPTLQRKKVGTSKVDKYFKEEEKAAFPKNKDDFSDLKPTESCGLDAKANGLAGCSVQ